MLRKMATADRKFPALPANRLTNAGSTRLCDRVSGTSQSQRLQILSKRSQ
ncbi:hypothetical protein [Microcoleus sp. Pol7_A1]